MVADLASVVVVHIDKEELEEACKEEVAAQRQAAPSGTEVSAVVRSLSGRYRTLPAQRPGRLVVLECTAEYSPVPRKQLLF